MSLTTNKELWKIMTVIFILLTLLFSLFFYFSTIFITFIVGLSLILITNRLKEDYVRKMRSYGYSLAKMKLYGYALFFFWIAITIFVMIKSVNDVSTLLTSFAGSEQTIVAKYLTFAQTFIPEPIFNWAMTGENIITAQRYVFSFIKALLQALSTFLFNAIMIIPLMFYMYFNKWKKIKRRLYAVVPKKIKNRVVRAAGKISLGLNEFLSAKVIESVIVGSVCCFGFFIAGLKGWLILGILAGFLNIVPYLGPIIGAVPPILLSILDEPIVTLYVLITVVVAQLVDNLYLLPFMISGKVKVDPLLSIFLILAGARILGIVGMIFAIPAYLVYKIVLKESYRELVGYYDD